MSASGGIIVLGGSGESGRRIVDHLARRYPRLRVASAARRPHVVEAGPGRRECVQLDLREREAARATIAEFDLAILAMGPTPAFGAEVHRLCLEAGVDCIDINDSLAVADQVLALHAQARDLGRRVFTGMGFTPGLSSLLLAQLAARRASPSGRYHIRSCMGAAYGGGESSPHAILATFSDHIEVFEGGCRRRVPTPWRDAQGSCPFPGQAEALQTIPFSALETASLGSGRSRVADGVAALDARYHIQYLKPGFARFMARFRWSETTLDRLARKFHASGQTMKAKKDADPDTVLWVYPHEAPEQGLLVQGVISSYDLTALMACALADAWLADELADYQGVYTVDQLEPESWERLSGHLARRGISSKPADLAALRAQGLDFGWVEAVAGDAVSDLAHYGANWYTAKPVHPKMVPLQKRFLVESEVWAALRGARRGTRWITFILLTLMRWRRHYRALADLRVRDDAATAKLWQAVTRDIAMFTSGYSHAREVLGRDEALRLYGKMFLETGRMEMRWLWPDASVFAAFDQPWRAVSDYWIAFLAGCEALGVLRYRLREEQGRISCMIEYCAYAEMFARLDCPELALLVREMEREALEAMAAHSGLRVNWTSHEDGTAEIVLGAPSAVVQAAPAEAV
ncbi:saccharopine dehydrogenase [Marichromatium purpuratum 984]|uniref:Saccharopine dehydrogenase n=1 Tax=Marichromatium purpuratum 984 TaxID=765910 RepID=W0E0A9_MARPU|nr:saccharopine dehydrogenase NADP-binding domain-containing protein [Marichromatium purpuratum]AHF02963.1 saccharopine dehydrogenase [Marichromatium purpuratum 984]